MIYPWGTPTHDPARLPAIELPFITSEDWIGAYLGVTAPQALEDMVLLSAERITAARDPAKAERDAVAEMARKVRAEKEAEQEACKHARKMTCYNHYGNDEPYDYCPDCDKQWW